MAGDFKYAGFWRRLVAHVIDNIIIVILLLALVSLLYVGWSITIHISIDGQNLRPAFTPWILVFLLFVGRPIYFACFESSAWQATPGKRLLSLKVTDDQGNPIGFWRSFGRNIGKIISRMILYIGFMMAGFTRRKQALHDMMAGCLVIRYL